MVFVFVLNNLNFLLSIFADNKDLIKVKKEINSEINYTKKSIPFNLGREKMVNPFLSLESSYYQNYIKQKQYNELEMFTHIRDLKNNY